MNAARRAVRWAAAGRCLPWRALAAAPALWLAGCNAPHVDEGNAAPAGSAEAAGAHAHAPRADAQPSHHAAEESPPPPPPTAPAVSVGPAPAAPADHQLLHPGGGDPRVCVCRRVIEINGWCDHCGVGYVAGVPVRSELLFETLDPHGHEIAHDSISCMVCRDAIPANGWCDACRMGWQDGLAWMTRITWTLAKGEPANGADLCPGCTAAAEIPGRAADWCAVCEAGIVSTKLFRDSTQHADAARQIGILLAALETAERCELCACAQVADDMCPVCRVRYRNGVAALP